MGLSIFYNSYPINNSLKFQLKLAAFFALFVFLFLFIFQPFQISLLKESLAIVAAGFALVTFATMLLLNALLPFLFQKHFKEESWTVGNELLYTLLNIWIIGILNFLYYNYFFTNNFSWSSLWWFQFSTIAIGIFPITFIILLKERNNRKKYKKEADSLSHQLKEGLDKEGKAKGSIFLSSQNKNESISISADRLYFLQAADNYVEVYFMENSLQKKMIRNTLKKIESDFSGYSNFFRCHKSFIVNLDKVAKVSGNAQGYKLHLLGTDQKIPVSRQNNWSIKERFSK